MNLSNGKIKSKYGPAHTSYAQLPLKEPMLMHPVGLGPKFGWRLQPHPYFVYARSKGSGESAHMCKLAWAWAFTACWCDKYRKLMYRPIYMEEILSWLN